MDNKERYKDAVSHALAGFQLIEAGLKFYIGYYYDVARFILDGKLAFKYEKSDINEAALEKLLSIFKKINSNEELIKNIRKLIHQRNHIAHKALAQLYGSKRTDSEFATLADEYAITTTEITKILDGLQAEHLLIHEIHKKLGIQ